MPCLQGIEASQVLRVWMPLSCLRAVSPEPRVLLLGEGAPTAKSCGVSSLAYWLGLHSSAHLPKQECSKLEGKERRVFILSKQR